MFEMIYADGLVITAREESELQNNSSRWKDIFQECMMAISIDKSPGGNDESKAN